MIQIRRQPGSLVVVGDHFGAGRKGGFDPGLGHQAFFHGFLGHQTGRHHHARVGGVGARGDCGNHHGAIFQAIGFAFPTVFSFAHQIGIAHRHATTALALKAAFFFIGGFELQAQEVIEGLTHVRQRHAVLRALWPGQAGLHGAHVEGQGVGEHRFLTRLAPQALRFAIGFDQLYRGFGAT